MKLLRIYGRICFFRKFSFGWAYDTNIWPTTDGTWRWTQTKLSFDNELVEVFHVKCIWQTNSNQFFPNTHNGFWISSRVAFERLHEIFHSNLAHHVIFFVIWRVFFNERFEEMNIYIPDAWPIRQRTLQLLLYSLLVVDLKPWILQLTHRTRQLKSFSHCIFFNSWTSPIMLPISLIWIYISLMVLLRGAVLCVPSHSLAK